MKLPLPRIEALANAPSDLVTQTIEHFYEESMRSFIGDAMTARSEEDLCESLAKAEQLQLRRQRVLAWSAAQQTAGSVPTAPQSSAA